jgi:uncharacterized protein (TIGR02145 family)
MKSLFVIFTFAFCIFTFQFTKAQNIGIGTNAPHASAALDVTSTNSGFLPPRMTLAQRNAIVNSAKGLIVFCTDCGSNGEMQYYNGNAWVTMSIMPDSSVGQIMYWNGNSWVNVPAGSYGQSLVNCDGILAWGGCVPKVATGFASSVSYTSITFGGIVLAEGGFSVSSRGVCWSTSPNPTVELTTKTNDGTGIGNFTSSITGLTPNTTYYVRAYATNSVGTAYGSQQSFTTSPLTIPTVTTEIPSAVSYTTATCGGNITSGGGATVTSRGVCWSTSPNPTITLTSKTVDGTGTGSFSSNITDLTPNTTYYIRAYASNSLGTSYGAQQTFTTLPVTVATIITASVSSITTTSASCGGNIIDDGGSSVFFRGVCWSTSQNPTVDLSTKTADGTGAGTFTSTITDLTANTTYYVRAYAINSVGTSYGAQQTFTTTTNIANLPSVTIGTQIWSSRNLDVATYRNGDPIPQVTDPIAWSNMTTGAWCWYNNDSANYAAIYGRLYNWYAVNDPRGLAPQGWHVPTDAEWVILTDFLGGESVAGGAMKSTSTWISPNTGATNSSGFSGLSGGYRNYGGSFYGVGYYAYWWSASVYDTPFAWSRVLYYDDRNVNKFNNIMASGFSVRVVRD